MRTRTKILVVDDSSDFQLFMKAFLDEEHYAVLSSRDTLQATGIALRDKPALIVLDLGLPGGDGWMLLDRLKTNILTKHIPIVIVTGQTKTDLEHKSRSKGAAGFFSKPLDKNAFIGALTAILAPESQFPTPLLPTPPLTT
ncbi:MAG: response regulator [Nitrospira sp.]|nr:response regulator [Nitrospira sp.]